MKRRENVYDGEQKKKTELNKRDKAKWKEKMYKTQDIVLSIW